MSKAVLLTGSNLGDRENNMSAAEAGIEERIGHIVEKSGIVESEPWGFSAMTDFLNRVLVVETILEPEQVLKRCLEIEKELGRERKGRAGAGNGGYASRTMDIDILFYDDLMIETPALTIPHPLIERRKFVLEPLAQIIPDYIHPRLGKSIAWLLDAIS